VQRVGVRQKVGRESWDRIVGVQSVKDWKVYTGGRRQRIYIRDYDRVVTHGQYEKTNATNRGANDE
jgi:hypothetical protein